MQGNTDGKKSKRKTAALHCHQNLAASIIKDHAAKSHDYLY